MQLIFILEQVLNGLLIGVYYLLIALGLSLIFSLGGIVNLAHGAFYAIGAYLAYLLDRPHRFRRQLHRCADHGRADRHRDRAVSVPPLLPLRPDPLAAAHLRPRDDRRAGVAHDLRRVAVAALDALDPARPGVHRRLHLFVLPADDALGRGRRRDAHLAPDLPHAVRPRGARRRAEPRDGRRARHLARALHDGDRGARRRPRRPVRRAARADRHHPSGDGAGDPHRGLRGRGDRRARLVLGRGRGRPAGRRGARTHQLLPAARERSLDVSADGARAAVPARAACSASASRSSSSRCTCRRNTGRC